ncbi:mycofactocin biosynthesis glycosyltransferase MftF [Nocardioides panacihumi]|uniref:Mycofactocin biosynthesis glycosyltransferase MftF n=1 Tax=Nocardioides panacihumi TaxID=400774 RepID=A0ABP5BPZ8_9ACTN
MSVPVAVDRLPNGFAVRIRDDVRQNQGKEGSVVLVGGSPLRAMALAPAARRLVEGGTVEVTDETSATVARRLLDANLADPVLAAGVEPEEITVVVPVRDRPEQLDRCLRVLAGIAVIVVDDASLDPDTVAGVAARHGAAFVLLPVNLGPAGARNAGLCEVGTPYVAFVDSDVTVEAKTLLTLAGHLHDPLVALAGPLVRGMVRSARPKWFERFDAASSSLALGDRACSVKPGAAVGWLPSACLVGRTSTLLDAGGFAEQMRVGEDVDLVWRLVAAGRRVRYEPALEACHDVRDSIAGWLGRKVAYGSGGAALAERHGDAVAVARLTPLMAAAGAGLLMRKRWSLLGAAVATGWAARTVHRALPEFEGRRASAAALAARGLGWAARQESALLLRHWWPAAAVLATVSPTARRAMASAVVVDAIVAATVDRPLRRDDSPRLGLAEVALGRRLDDLAYGLGLWSGALRRRSWRALAIAITRTGTNKRGLPRS